MIPIHVFREFCSPEPQDHSPYLILAPSRTWARRGRRPSVRCSCAALRAAQERALDRVVRMSTSSSFFLFFFHVADGLGFGLGLGLGLWLGLGFGTSDGGFRRAPCARGLLAPGVDVLVGSLRGHGGGGGTLRAGEWRRWWNSVPV